MSSSGALGLFPYPTPFSCFCLALKASRHLANCGPLLLFRLEFFCLRYRSKLHKNPLNVVGSYSDPSFFSYGQQTCAEFFIQGLGRKNFDFRFFSPVCTKYVLNKFISDVVFFLVFSFSFCSRKLSMSSNFTSLNLSSDGLIFEEFAFSMILKSGNSFVVVSSHSNSSVDNTNSKTWVIRKNIRHI